MKPRVLILLISAITIVALVEWRLNRDTGDAAPTTTPGDVRRLAPRFELYDQHSQLVKFERYLGRTRLLVLFIGDATVEQHPLVQLVSERHDALEATGVQVIIVGTATPYAIREAEKRRGAEFPFPILSDVNLQTPEPAPVHRQWGLTRDDSPEIRDGLFLIDREGTVRWTGSAPQPAIEPSAAIESITRGDWP